MGHVGLACALTHRPGLRRRRRQFDNVQGTTAPMPEASRQSVRARDRPPAAGRQPWEYGIASPAPMTSAAHSAVSRGN